MVEKRTEKTGEGRGGELMGRGDEMGVKSRSVEYYSHIRYVLTVGVVAT